MRKNFLFCLGFLLFFFSLTFAQISDIFLPTKTPPEIKCGEDFFSCLAFFLTKILQLIIVGAIFLATVFIAYAGILYIVKGNQAEELKKVSPMIKWAVVGLVVALFAYAFVRFLENALREERIFLPAFVYAQEFEEKPLPEALKCGEISLPSVFKTTKIKGDVWRICLLYYLNRFLSFFYGLALALGVLFLAWAGILYITNPEKSSETHKRLKFGIIGIVIAILSFTIVKMIDLFFLKL